MGFFGVFHKSKHPSPFFGYGVSSFQNNFYGTFCATIPSVGKFLNSLFHSPGEQIVPFSCFGGGWDLVVDGRESLWGSTEGLCDPA